MTTEMKLRDRLNQIAGGIPPYDGAGSVKFELSGDEVREVRSVIEACGVALADLDETQGACIDLQAEKDAASSRVAQLRQDLLVYGEHCMRAGYGIGVTHAPGQVGLPFPDSEFKRRVATICQTPLAIRDGDAVAIPAVAHAVDAQREQTTATILAALIERGRALGRADRVETVAEAVEIADELRAALRGGGE